MSDGLRRIAFERIDKAMKALQRVEEPIEGIHDARKRFKEIRSLLRLARGLLGPSYESENAWYRDAGRSLGGPRESQVALLTWETLLKCFPDLEAGPEGRQVGQRLEAHLEALSERATREVEGTKQRLLEALPQARERIASWPFENATFGDLAGGICRTYRQGRKGLRRAHGRDDDALWHEWRKRTQDLWYHTRLLRPAWPDVMHAREKELKRLSGLLGDDHDLVVFRGLFSRETDLFGQQIFRGQLGERIKTRQRELRAKASREGRRLWSKEPDSYTRRVQAHWDAWKAS